MQGQPTLEEAAGLGNLGLYLGAGLLSHAGRGSMPTGTNIARYMVPGVSITPGAVPPRMLTAGGGQNLYHWKKYSPGSAWGRGGGGSRKAWQAAWDWIPSPWSGRDPESIMRVGQARAYRAFQSDLAWNLFAAAKDASPKGLTAMGEAISAQAYKDLGRHGLLKGGTATLPKFLPMVGGKELFKYGYRGSMMMHGASLLGTFAMNALIAKDAADLIVGLSSVGINALIEMGKPRDLQPRYYQTPQAYTMRQAGLQAMYQSQMSTRSAIGREAQILHF